jgi:hypothetical protein
MTPLHPFSIPFDLFLYQPSFLAPSCPLLTYNSVSQDCRGGDLWCPCCPPPDRQELGGA